MYHIECTDVTNILYHDENYDCCTIVTILHDHTLVLVVIEVADSVETQLRFSTNAQG
jgi:hypothetical protein